MRELGDALNQGLNTTESRLDGIRQGMNDSLDKTKSALAETEASLHADNKETRKEVAGVFSTVKSNKPLLIAAIVLLVIVIVLQLAPMVFGFLK